MENIQRVLINLGADPSALQPLYVIDGHNVYHVITTGEEALDVWVALRSGVEQMGYWPVILGDTNVLYEELQEIAEEELAPRQIIARAEELDAVQWLKNRVASEPDYYEFRYGEWPTSGATVGKYMIYRHAEDETPLSDVSVALIPTTKNWETPGFLGFGGWSDCPFAEEHVAMLKRWSQLYGAEVVGISRSRLEMRVLTPPRDQQKAMELAQEHFIYCPELVHQGTQTLNSLAANICNNTIWNFWWD